MKSILVRAIAASSLGLAAMAAQATDVGVSVSIGDPRFFGRIDIGSYPRPALIYPEPVLIAPPRGPAYAPVYLRVPPGHTRDWKKHCRKYDACGRPVYFVQDDWYQNVYAPEYREKHGKGRGKGHGKGKKDD